jgi:hypothetical protein
MVLHATTCGTDLCAARIQCRVLAYEGDLQMPKSNLTIKIDDDLIYAVRVLAAQKNSSISDLVSTYIENVVRNGEEYQAAKERALARMKKGWDLGWKPVSREESHER